MKKGQPHTPESRAKIAAAVRQNWSDPAYRAKRIANWRRSYWTPERLALHAKRQEEEQAKEQAKEQARKDSLKAMRLLVAKHRALWKKAPKRKLSGHAFLRARNQFIHAAYADGLPLADIGKIFELTRQRVHQVIAG